MIKVDSFFKDQSRPGSLPHVGDALSLNSTQARHIHGLNVGLYAFLVQLFVTQAARRLQDLLAVS
jgi:hypothetical protein